MNAIKLTPPETEILQELAKALHFLRQAQPNRLALELKQQCSLAQTRLEEMRRGAELLQAENAELLRVNARLVDDNEILRTHIANRAKKTAKKRRA